MFKTEAQDYLSTKSSNYHSLIERNRFDRSKFLGKSFPKVARTKVVMRATDPNSFDDESRIFSNRLPLNEDDFREEKQRFFESTPDAQMYDPCEIPDKPANARGMDEFKIQHRDDLLSKVRLAIMRYNAAENERVGLRVEQQKISYEVSEGTAQPWMYKKYMETTQALESINDKVIKTKIEMLKAQIELESFD